MRKMFENGPQNHSKIDPKMLQNRLQKGAEAKHRKSVKTNNTPSFLVHFCYPRASKIQQNSLKSGVENEIKIKCDFEVDFSMILEDFGAILGSKIVRKWKKNGIKNRAILDDVDQGYYHQRA